MRKSFITFTTVYWIDFMHLKSFFRRIISKTSSSVSGFKSLCLQAGQAILNNAGNLKKAGESLCKWSIVKNMGKSMVLACVLPIPPEGQMDFAEHLHFQVIEKISTVGVDILFGEKLKNAVKSNLRSFGSDLIGVELSKRIGKAYKENKIPGVVHKLSHALSGGLQGWMQGDVWSGAFGAFMAESFVDLFNPNEVKKTLKNDISPKTPSKIGLSSEKKGVEKTLVNQEQKIVKTIQQTPTKKTDKTPKTEKLRGVNNPTVKESVNYGKQKHDEFSKQTEHMKVEYTDSKNIPDRNGPICVHELKPGTVSGVKKGLSQIKRYEEAFDKK